MHFTSENAQYCPAVPYKRPKAIIDDVIKNILCNTWHHKPTLRSIDTGTILDTWRIEKHLTDDTSNIPALKLTSKFVKY
jgi:hypothetical protein